MPVSVARHAGFCMGVKRAVDGAVKAAQEGKPIVSFGELAHNPEVIRRLNAMGISVIHEVEQARGKVVLIRSHGVAPEITEALRRVADEVIDLTCPFVARLHDVVARYSSGGLPVILVGQRDHPEVIGTIGYGRGTVYTVHDPEEAAALPQMDRALAVSQTTFPHERWEEILPVLHSRVKNLTVQDTICTATALRQNEARELAAKVDAMLVVGGLGSANTRKLYETCKRICGRTLLVERAADIPPGFANIHSESIGITAGASTPDWSLKEVVTRMTDKEQLDRQVSTEEAEKDSFMADVEATLVKIRPGQTVKGTVVQITDDEVCVNIGFKSDGLIKREDLVTEDVKLGDEIEVEVVKVNDGEGNVLLSQRNILNRKAFAELVQKYENNEYVEGVGKEVVKGGLICTVNGIRAFVPASQLSNRYVEKIGDFVVDCIVAMPSQLFYTTQIPVSLWFLARNKRQKGKTLFIDARKMGTMVTRKLRELTDEDIRKLADTYNAFVDGTLEDVKGFCAVATTEEIARQDYILTPGRYVGIEEQQDDSEPFEEKMTRLTKELSEMFRQSHELEAQIREKLGGIGYEV